MGMLTTSRKLVGACALGALAGALAVSTAHATDRPAPWFGPVAPKVLQHAKPSGTQQPFPREAKFIRSLYRGYLNREPSSDEVRGWQRVLGEKTGATEVIRSFMESDEYFVRQVYLGLLRREPDASGKETYTRALRQGASRADVIETILGSEEFARLMR